MKKASSYRNGFSLTELLVVVSVMALLGTLTSSLIRSSAAGRLTTQGTRVASLLEQARNAAISSRCPTAFVFITGNGFQVCRLLEFVDDSSGTGSGTWNFLSSWEVLPPGVVIDPSEGTNCVPTKCSAVNQPLPVLNYQGTAFQPNVQNGYGYIVFLENGEPLQDASGNPAFPCRLRLVQGVSASSSTVTYAGAQTTPGNPANYFDIYLNDPTGQIKTSRP